MKFHILASFRALPAEGLERVWGLLHARLPEVVIATLMPDHFHAVGSMETHRVLGTLTRAHRRHQIVDWCPLQKPRPIEGALHLERAIRYDPMNPCRDRLASDPLEWPWTTYHDALGLTVEPWTPPAFVASHFRRPPTPEELHAYVSSDTSVHANGTPFPSGATRSFGREPIPHIVAAARCVAPWWSARRGRPLVVQAALRRHHRPGEVARALGVSRRTVERDAAAPLPATALDKALVALADDRLVTAGTHRLPRDVRLIEARSA